MNKLIGQIKYRLLKYLLDDICKKSDCDNCRMNYPNNGCLFCPCAENFVFVQACKVWCVKD